MASRQMVGLRKGAALSGPPDSGSDAGDPAASKGADDSDVVECPNCACQFDEQTGDVVKPGAKVVGGPAKDGYQGADLDLHDSAEPVPGKFGTAHDAALGDAVTSSSLASLIGGALHGGSLPRPR